MRSRPRLPAAFHDRNFRIFGFGYAISSMGSDFTLLAMAWQIYDLTSSPLQVGLIGLARLIPLMTVVLLGGMLADALDRRGLLMATQVAQLVITASLAALTLADLVTPLLLYLGAAALSICTALDNPARTSIVPNLVPPENLASGVALMNLQQKIGSVIGPTAAGIALVIGGPALCYLADSASWLTLLVALTFVRAPTQTRVQRGPISLRPIAEGVKFVWAQPVILSVFILDFGAQFLGTNRALLPAYARDVLDVGSPGLGLLFAAQSVGAVISGVLVGFLPPTRRMGLWILTGVVTYAVCSAVFAVSRDFSLSLLMMAGIGAGNALSVVLRGTISQIDTPDALRGRVASVSHLFTGTGPRLGMTQMGLVAEAVGTPTAALAGAVATLGLTAVIAAVSPLRHYEPRKKAAIREIIATQEQTEGAAVLLETNI